MDKFFQDISSLYWWISVVVVGILINIFGNYLPKLLSKVSTRSRNYWIERSEKRKKEYEDYVQLLESDIEERYITSMEILEDSVTSMMGYAIGGLFISRSEIVSQLMGAILIIASFWRNQFRLSKKTALKDAKKRLKEKSTNE